MSGNSNPIKRSEYVVGEQNLLYRLRSSPQTGGFAPQPFDCLAIGSDQLSVPASPSTNEFRVIELSHY
jgi:hypothetical protein